MKKVHVIKDGNLSGWLRTVLCVLGAGIVYSSVRYVHSMLLMSLGLLLVAIGGYASRAHTLKIKPFDNSYQKARRSYEEKQDRRQKLP
jgi:hypothetical protein